MLIWPVRWLCIGMTLVAGAAMAQPQSLPWLAKVKVADVEVAFPVEARLSDAVPAPFVATIDISDFARKIDDIIRSAGLDRPPGDYQSFDYRGTILAVAGERLWAKYHFRVDPRRAKPTNGSLELFFRPVITDNTLRLVAEGGRLNVSNTIAKGVVSALGLDRKITERILSGINEVLTKPAARLELPPELKETKSSLGGARFAKVAAGDVLVIEGALELTPAALISLIGRLSRAGK